MALEEECTCPDIEERVEWIYTYGDMVTLLLAFFILLFATAKTETEKLKAISASFRGGPPASPFMFTGMPTFMESLEAQLKKSDMGESTSVTVDDRGITVSFNDSAMFDPASADLTKKSKETLSKFARILYAIPNSVVVEGHTDNIPIQSGVFPSNWELSGARAGAVARELEALGIRSERMELAGYGSTRPRASNDTPEQRALNRRIDILIKPDDGP